MDFIDNLLNHMSSKFNQESTLPKQAEISMDETFKWRALKNNQFASRSKNGRSKIKSKDKDKQDTASSELNVSSDENNKSDSFQDPTVANVSESADIEIEIAHDISGAEIQEVLASTQGTVPVLLQVFSEPQDINLHEESEIVNTNNNSEIIESPTCVSNIEHINDEVFEKVVHNENVESRTQDNCTVEQKEAESTNAGAGSPERDTTNTKPNDHDAENIFMQMSSTFNGSCVVNSSSVDNSLPTQNSNPANEEISSSNLTTENNSNVSENLEDHSSPTSVRRSKRLKQDLAKDTELIDMEHLSNQKTASIELPLITSKSSSEMNEEQTSKDVSVKTNDDVTDSAVRILRNKSFEIKPKQPEAKTKSTPKKTYKVDSKVQESLRKTNHGKELRSISADSRKVTRSRTILRKIPTTRRTQLIRSNYPTRQRNRSLDEKPEKRKRSSRFWKNAKSQTSKLRKESSEQQQKHSHESLKETVKVKNFKDRSPKRSVRLSRDGSDGILASAIARREKNDTTGFQGRLSRPIKLSAKILANDELRYGFELQNNARLNLNAEVKEPAITKESHVSDVETTSEKPEASAEKAPTPISEPDNTSAETDSIVPEPLGYIQIKCPDPLEFLNEVKRSNLCSNRSPECNCSLTKIQQRKLLKEKEKHLFMLGLRKTNNLKALTDTKHKVIETVIVNKEDTETITHSPDTAITSFTNVHDGENNDETKIQTEVSIRVLPAEHLQSKLLCFCQRDTRYFTTKTQSRMFCTATDDIDGQFVGCINELEGGLQNLLRPSHSASYQLLCRTHQQRLHHHGCCATCGVYCTQGCFVICTNKHLFHRECAEKFIINTKGKSSPIIPKLVLKCPHCGLESVIREYEVRLHNSFGIVSTRQ